VKGFFLFFFLRNARVAKGKDPGAAVAQSGLARPKGARTRTGLLGRSSLISVAISFLLLFLCFSLFLIVILLDFILSSPRESRLVENC
jgi:hypothetical protein